MAPVPIDLKDKMLYATSNSFLNAKISSTRISQDETQMNSQVSPVIMGGKTQTRFGRKF